MGKRESYAPGTFSWTDLATTDPDAAKAFYSEVFGWVAEDIPVGDGVVYSMMRRDGSDAAAISPQQAQELGAGARPAWQSYVAVTSADTTAARVAELGGSVAAPPFDVMDAGRMTALIDPQGAMFMAWEPGRNTGAGIVNGPGALSWNELSTPDIAAAAAFYGDLFGWTTSSFEGSPEPYLLIKNGERSNGGIHALSQPGAPPSWLVYFGVDDIDASLTLIERLGGSTIVGSTDIGVAKIAVVADPQGAAFAIYAGTFED